MEKLRREAQILKIDGRSKMSKKDLEEAIRLRNTKGIQTDEDIAYCDQCTIEQYQQQCINEEVYNQRQVASIFRKIAIEYDKNRKKVYDDGAIFDADTGEVIDYY